MQFDISQGVYNPLSFSFVFRPDEEESSIVDDIGSWMMNNIFLNKYVNSQLYTTIFNNINKRIFISDINPWVKINGLLIPADRMQR